MVRGIRVGLLIEILAGVVAWTVWAATHR